MSIYDKLHLELKKILNAHCIIKTHLNILSHCHAKQKHLTGSSGNLQVGLDSILFTPHLSNKLIFWK